MYDFNAMEAVDDLIDEINEEYTESPKDIYDAIYEELCERVECGELTLEEAEVVNDLAHRKAVVRAAANTLRQEESKLKSCINKIKQNAKSENYDQAYLAVIEAGEHKRKIEQMIDDIEEIDLNVFADAIDNFEEFDAELNEAFQFIDELLSTESVVTESVKIEFKALIKSNPAKALTALKQRFRKSSTKLDRSLKRYAKALKKKAANGKKSIAEGTKKLQKKIRR